MNLVVLADFGSTFTKVTVVEDGSGRMLARSQAPSTTASDVMEGYAAALENSLSRVPGPTRVVATLASSSAGGGLRVAAVGLVPELTGLAARQAALNAGARVELVIAGVPSDADLTALEELRPDIILFAGGTDGGQRRLVLESADAIAATDIAGSVVVACNSDIARPIASLFRRGGRDVRVVANVMPHIFELNISPTQRAINDAFLTHVIHGKSLSKSDEFAQSVLMPTPEAVLQTTRLMATGADGRQAARPLAVVDIGGATTDVHSYCVALDSQPPASAPLLPTPALLRSVQGDLGLRESAPGVLDADRQWVEGWAGEQAIDPGRLRAACERRRSDRSFLPRSPDEQQIDLTLAASCVAVALVRHCGRMSVRQRPSGSSRQETVGPDLRTVGLLVGTGGIFAGSSSVRVLEEALSRNFPRSLIPLQPELAVDENYLIAAAGLYATRDPVGAYSLMCREVLLVAAS